ncbi:MAG: thioredoxin, partial [Pseudomonadota bacterium]|nr:thioredoxin [Pseudomonadota bacterium]
ILQLNIIGSRIVKDFDGTETSEKDLAQKYGIRFTPSVQFFPLQADGLGSKSPKDREVARASGYLAPDHFLKMFQFVKDEAYTRTNFRKYLKEGV